MPLHQFPHAYSLEHDIALWSMRFEDIPALYEVMLDSGPEAINAPGAVFYPACVNTEADYIEHMRHVGCGISTSLPAVVLASGRHVGYIEFAMHKGGYNEFLYWIGAKYRGHGIAPAALALATQAVHAAGVVQTHLRIDPLNTPSATVAERAGYTYIGPLDDAYDEWRHGAS